MPYDLQRPDHLDDESWEAIKLHARRLEMAQTAKDGGLVVGSAKDLVESVARVVLDARSAVIPANADFDVSINTAHVALERQPGRNVSMSSDVRDIASSAKKMMVAVREVRNAVGSGHGRPRVPHVDDEMATIVVDAALLWSRWALRRLSHLLAGEADKLIAELRDATTTRRSLSSHLDAVMLSDQPADIQRAIGGAFGARAAQDTFIASAVGIEPAIASDDLAVWPVAYRIGVVEGLLLGRWGYRTMTDRYIRDAAGVLSAVPVSDLLEVLPEVVEKVRTAGYPGGTIPSARERTTVAAGIRASAELIPDDSREIWLELAGVYEVPDPDEYEST